jgi:lysophospholipase L1-like esterase
MLLTIAIPLFLGLAAPAVVAQDHPATQPATTRPAGPARWEKEIAAFEAADRANPPAKGGIVFTGSSTIKRWNTLAQDFSDRNVLNRGFGGCQIEDCTYFADRIVFPYEPRMVVLRAGGNDIHAGKSAERVFEDWKGFVAKIHAKMPNVPIVFIGLAPAPSRWDERAENKKLNDLVEAHVKTRPNLKFIDTYDTTITTDGQAREDLFVKDRLHFNEAGYKLLAERVRPALTK